MSSMWALVNMSPAGRSAERYREGYDRIFKKEAPSPEPAEADKPARCQARCEGWQCELAQGHDRQHVVGHWMFGNSSASYG